jgi:general secretion pathway protein N
MSNRLPWIALAFGAYLAFLLSQFPAATAIRWFAPSALRAAGVSGTIWSGGAALASVPGLPLRDLEWELGRLPLVIGRLSGRVSARLADGFIDSEFAAPIWAVSSGSIALRQTRFSTSLSTLRGLLPISGITGQASATFERIAISDGWPRNAVGSLRLSDLQVEPFAGAGTSMIRLGEYEVTFQETNSPTVAAAFRDTGGPLEVVGTLSLSPNREYVLEGSLTPRANAQRELVQGLSIMLPEPDENGRRSFSFPGSL